MSRIIKIQDSQTGNIVKLQVEDGVTDDEALGDYEADQLGGVVSNDTSPAPIEQSPSVIADMAKGAIRGIPSGLASLPLLGAEALTYLPQKLYEQVRGRPVNDDRGSIEKAIFNPMDAFQSGITDLGFENPETAAGRLAGDVVGGVTGAFGGVGLGRSLATAAGPRISALGKLLSAAPKSQIVAGGAAGGAAGSTRELGGSPTAQLLAGLSAGVGAPTAFNMFGRGAANIAAPFSTTGSTNRIANQLREVLGPEFDNVVRRLENATPSMSGAAQTAGEVIGVPAVSILQRTAMQSNPQVGQALGRQMDDAAAIAIERLRSAGGNVDDLIAARGATTGPMYDDVAGMDVPLVRPYANRISGPLPSNASSAGLGQDTGFLDYLTNLTKTKSGKAAMAHAVDVAKNRAAAVGIDPDTISGVIPSSATHIKGAPLMDIKKAIAELIEKKPEGLSTNSLNVLQKAYQQQLRSNFPEYKNIDDIFASMSKPIDQAKILDEVAKRGINVFGDRLNTSSMAKALANKDLPKSATGNNYASWKDLTDPQRKTLSELLGFARGRDAFGNAGRAGGGSDTAQKLEYKKILEGAGLPAWLSGAAGAKSGGLTKLLESLYRDAAVNKTGDALTDLLSDPKKLASALKNAPARPLPFKMLAKSRVVPSLTASNQSSK